ncbi:hypothetical protein [Streptomyces sp. NPDC050388]|uniref:hypothetical protein n=1 Tax=Streptomyces sp. NPDC050388 TaxID=3155781 RepID=UPI003432095C
MTEWYTVSLQGALRDLQTEGPAPSVGVRIRHAPLIPAFKLCPFNAVEALHGMYEVVERPMELESGEIITALDVLGLGATLTHHVKDEDPTSSGTVFVDSVRQWYDPVGELLSTDA